MKKIKESVVKYITKHAQHEEKIHEFAEFLEKFFQDMDEEFDDVKHAFYDEVENFTNEIDEEMLTAIIENLKRRDGTAGGLKWTKEDVNAVVHQYDVISKLSQHGKTYDPVKFWFAMNYVYATHFSVSRTINGYVDLAIDEITNKNMCFDDLIRRIFEKI
jgi:hypothetical protein